MIDKIDKNILVLGTMSSGKSTLINALIGKDIFPSSNEACTAKVMTYTSDNTLKNIKATVYGRYKMDYDNLKKQDIEILNNHEEFKRVEFYGSIHSDLEKDIKIKFIDTPGVNNSQDIRHEEITYEALENEKFDTILYVLNATQLGTDDDALLLQQLKNYIYKNPSKDVIFVLNKIDEIDIDIENIEDVYLNTIRYISKNTHIKCPKLVSISSYYAKLIKKHRNDIELTRKENKKLRSFLDYIDEQDLKIKKLSNLKYLTAISDENVDKLLTEVGICNLEKYLFDGVNREVNYMSVHIKLGKIKKLRDLSTYCENTDVLLELLRENDLLNNETKELREYLKNISNLNSKEAKMLHKILAGCEDHPVVFSIIKSLKYASNDEKKKRFMKFDKVLKEIEEEINTKEEINTEEILDFIIDEIKSNQECAYTELIENEYENKEKIKLISDFINIVKSNIEEEKFKVVYRKSVTQCSGNITIIEQNGTVRMLSGSQFEQESIPKFDRPIVDIDDGIALDDTGKVYQWGHFCKPIPSNLPKIKQVASHSNTKIALDEFGTIHSWGSFIVKNPFENSNIHLNSKIVQIESKAAGVVLLDEKGKVHCYGFNSDNKIYNIPKDLPYIRKVQIIDGKSVMALDKDGKVHFWGETEGNISVLHMLPMIVDITVSDKEEYCIGLDTNGKIHQLSKVSIAYSSTYKLKQLEDVKYLTPYGAIGKNGDFYKYVDSIIEFESFEGIKVKIPAE